MALKVSLLVYSTIMKQSTSYPGSSFTAFTTATAAICCINGIFCPRTDELGIQMHIENIKHPFGDSQALPDLPATD